MRNSVDFQSSITINILIHCCKFILFYFSWAKSTPKSDMMKDIRKLISVVDENFLLETFIWRLVTQLFGSIYFLLSHLYFIYILTYIIHFSYMRFYSHYEKKVLSIRCWLWVYDIYFFIYLFHLLRKLRKCYSECLLHFVFYE